MMIRPPSDGYTPALRLLSANQLRKLIEGGDTHAYAEWKWRLENRHPQRRKRKR